MSTNSIQRDRLSTELESTMIEVCAEELWDGVYCTLPPGHAGSHVSDGSAGGCSLTWRASSAVAGGTSASPSLDSFLRLMRAGSRGS